MSKTGGFSSNKPCLYGKSYCTSFAGYRASAILWYLFLSHQIAVSLFLTDRVLSVAKRCKAALRMPALKALGCHLDDKPNYADCTDVNGQVNSKVVELIDTAVKATIGVHEKALLRMAVCKWCEFDNFTAVEHFHSGLAVSADYYMTLTSTTSADAPHCMAAISSPSSSSLQSSYGLECAAAVTFAGIASSSVSGNSIVARVADGFVDEKQLAPDGFVDEKQLATASPPISSSPGMAMPSAVWTPKLYSKD
jgi:hypothetical protein